MAKKVHKLGLLESDSSDRGDDGDTDSDFDRLAIPQFVRGFTILAHLAKPFIAKYTNLVLEERNEDAELYP